MPLPTPFWKINVWADDSKATLLTPSQGITRLADGGVYRRSPLMEADDYKLSVILEDSVAAALSKGNYFEANNGNPGYQALWYGGYVDQIQKTAGLQSTYDIVGVSALSYLSSYRNGDALFASWGLGYHNLLQRLSGINQVGQPAGTNQKGVLPATWRVVWVDGTFIPAGSTTTVGTTPVNSTLIPVASSASINITNRAVQIGSDWYGLDPTNPNPDSTHIQIVAPGTIQSYAGGTAVTMAPYKLPGTGDSWFTANDTALNGLKADCARYNVFLRMRKGSLAHNGVVEIGPLLDSSGLQIWGAKQLASQQGTDNKTWSYDANAGSAQTSGYAVIEEAQYVDDMSKVCNVVWPFGKGKGDAARLIKTYMGGDPTPGATPPGNGWATYTPYVNDRVYYIKTASASTWNGNTYEYICFQRQDGLFQYGVINRGSHTAANQAPPYGIHETTLKDRKATTSDTLLSAALGAVEYFADPVPTYTFKVRHPLTSASGIPTVPVPGQSIDIRFTGEVHNAIDINSTTGPTYGQYVDVGSYRYIKFPTIADPTDENGAVDSNKVKKMQRLMQIEDQWTPDGQYEVTYTMGAGRWQSKHWEEAIAADMEAAHHETDPYHTFTKRPFHKVPFLFPTGNPSAYEDPSTRYMVINAGAFVPSDQPDTSYFTNGHQFRFTINLQDTAQVFDFAFGKANDGTLTNLTSSAVYALFRIACGTSGLTTGYFTRAANSLTLTKRGKTHSAPGLLDGNGRLLAAGQLTVFLTHLDNVFRALITVGDLAVDPTGNAKYPHPTSVWHDNTLVLNKFGAIGFALTGGSLSCTVQDLDASGYHGKHPPKKSVGRGQHAAHHPSTKSRKKPVADAHGHPIMRIVPI